MAGNRLGAKSSDEHRRKISEALTGKPLSAEHRTKMAVNADPELLKRKAATRKKRRRAPETHRAVHRRLYADRGPASNHLCVDCSGPADDWSYDWAHWEDVAQGIRPPRTTFSTNLDAYVPRCTPCHSSSTTPAAWNYGGQREEATSSPKTMFGGLEPANSPGALARELGVGRETMEDRTGRSWKHIAEALFRGSDVKGVRFQRSCSALQPVAIDTAT